MEITHDSSNEITFDMLPSLRITGSPVILRKVFKYFTEAGKELDFEFNDILVGMGLSSPPDFPVLMIQDYQKYLQMPEGKEKDQFKVNKNLSDDFIEHYKSDTERRHASFTMVPSKLLKYWMESENDLPVREAAEIIAEALKGNFIDGKVVSVDQVMNSDYLVIAEIFTRIFFKPESSTSKAFFLSLALNLLKRFIPILSITEIEK